MRSSVSLHSRAAGVGPAALMSVLLFLLAACGGEAAGEAAALETEDLAAAPAPEASSSTDAPVRLPSPADVDTTTTTTSSSTSASGDTSNAEPGASASAGIDGGQAGPTPNCLESCNIVLEGDSLTMGLDDWVCLEVQTGACINSGIGGNRVDQMIETARSDVDLHAGTGSNDVLMLWGGANDLWQQHHSEDPTENAEATYGFMVDYIAERRANGWDYILVMTNPPMNPSVIQGAEHLNELIRENTAGADVIIDAAAEPRLADPFDEFLRAPDGVHYKDPGREIVVYDYIVPAFKALDGS